MALTAPWTGWGQGAHQRDKPRPREAPAPAERGGGSSRGGSWPGLFVGGVTPVSWLSASRTRGRLVDEKRWRQSERTHVCAAPPGEKHSHLGGAFEGEVLFS